MRIYFTVWSVELKDNGYDMAIGDSFRDCLNIQIIDDLKVSSCKKTNMKHIKDNKYEIICYVYERFNSIVFVEISGLYFMINLREEQKLKKRKYYKFIGEIYQDQWNDLGMSNEKIFNRFYDEVDIKGKIKSIAFNTAKYKKISNNRYSGDGVELKFDYKIERTTKCGWGEEEKFPKAIGYYLVEIEISDLYIQRKRFIQVLNNINYQNNQSLIKKFRK